MLTTVLAITKRSSEFPNHEVVDHALLHPPEELTVLPLP